MPELLEDRESVVRKTCCYLAFLLLTGVLTSPGYAAESNPDKWRFTITPYLWVASIKGSTGADGVDAGIDIDYVFFSLDNLEGAFFIGATAGKGRWTLQTDFVYLNFADSFTLGGVDTSIDLKGDVVEVSAAYALQSVQYTEFLFGVRRVSIGLDVSLTPGPAGDDKQIWLDPIVGFRYARPLGERWHAIARADVGGFGFSSEFTVNVFAGAGLNMTRHSSLFFGYRYLTLDFNEDQYLIDLTAEGFALGVEFNF